MMIYAGIGSRETPGDIIKLMEDFAHAVADFSILRSGGADGADSAFEFGATLGGGIREIYLPWSGFNGRVNNATMEEPTSAAIEIAAHYHPAWGRLSQGARKLHGRNTHQILGADCLTPCELVVCWTKGAKGGGGTGQALRIARDYDIEIWDLADPEMAERVREVVGDSGIPL